jgi:hypothetical protein
VRASASVRALVLALAALCAAACAGPELRHVPDGWARIALACADESAEVTVDGAPAGRASDYTASGGRLLVRPGWHRIELRSQGELAVREALLGAGDDVSISVQLPAQRADANGAMR